MRHRACPGCGPGRRCPRRWPAPACPGPRARRWSRLSSSRAPTTASRSASRAVSTSRTAGALPARIWVHRPGSLAAIRVTSRRPWPARATAASSSPSSRAATRLAASWGTCDTAATAASWLWGSSVLTAAPAERATAVTSAVDRRVGLGGRREHPGPPVEEVVPPGHRPGALAAGHRVRPAVAGEVGAVGPQGVEHGDLDRGDVGDGGLRPAPQRGGHAHRRDVGRGGDDDEVGLDRAVGQPPGPEVAGQRRVGGADVLEGDVVAEPAQREPEAGADQPGADDVDPGHSSAAA